MDRILIPSKWTGAAPTPSHSAPIDVLIYRENYDDHGMPRPDYLERIIAGARWFDLPQAWIDDLAAVPV